MAKNTKGSQFRKVDVDAFDEDNFEDEEVGMVNEGEVQGRVKAVRACLNAKDFSGALHKALESPPQNSNNAALKEQSAAIVLDVIKGTKAADVAATVKGLSIEEADVLMKYIYRLMATPDEGSSAALLTWHKNVTDHAGLGCIVRVLADRKTV